ncbi:hypothetical protein Tco_0570881, partial [Tanacetum coccineum]
MPYPRFTKVVINHFISKDKTISTRNMMNLYKIRDDIFLGTLKYVSKAEDYQKYGALILEQMINQEIQDSKEYKIYLAFATGELPKKQGNTPDVSVSKKNEPTTTDKRKGIDLLSEAALLEDAQMKKVLKRRKKETHSRQASGSGDGVGSQPKVPNELQDKTTGTNEGTGTIPGVPDVPKDQSESENESWGESRDDDYSNDNLIDDDGNDDDNDNDGNNDVSDDERTESDEMRVQSNQNDDDKEKNEEEYDRIDKELYKDVNVKLKDVEHREEGKGDAEMTNASHDDVTQDTMGVFVSLRCFGSESDYHILLEMQTKVKTRKAKPILNLVVGVVSSLLHFEHAQLKDRVEDDAHVTLTAAHVSQKTKVPLQCSSVSSDFATQFLNLDNVPPTDNEIISMMNVDFRHEEQSNQTPSLLTIPATVIPKTLTAAAITIPPPIPPFIPPLHQSTPTPTPTPIPTTTTISVLPDFSSLFEFNQRVSNLENGLFELKQALIPAMVDAHLGIRL